VLTKEEIYGGFQVRRKAQAVKACEGVDVYLHSYSTSALDGG